MNKAISMRELQKMSAGAIQALPRATPIKNGASTVGILIPITKVAPDYLAKVVAGIAADWARATAEDRAWADSLAAERGIGWD